MGSFWHLPEEIVIDILSRLPAKLVGLCRCVWKPWRALLSRPEFIRTHLHRTRILPQESLFFLDSWSSAAFAPLSNAHHLFDKITLYPTNLRFADYPNPFSWIIASCDGLLFDECHQVLNPVTREIREVPLSPYRLDPFKRSVYNKWGFGYDSVNDDYKVVYISYYGFDLDDDDNKIKPECVEMFVSIYSLKSGSWRRAQNSPYDHSVDDEFDSGVFVDGCIHWLAGTTTDCEPAIVAFNLAEEKFYEVPSPCLIESDRILFFHLTVLGGCLCLYNDTKNYVWVMTEYGVQKSWTMFKINEPEFGEIRLLCSLGEEEVVLSRDDKKLAVYNVKKGNLKDIVVHGIAAKRAVSFTESLVSPHAWW